MIVIIFELIPLFGHLRAVNIYIIFTVYAYFSFCYKMVDCEGEYLPFPFFSDEEWQRFLRRTSRQTSRCSSGRRRCSRSRPGRGLVIHRTGTEKGKRGIPHQAQSQHLAVEHLGLFRLCRCDEGDKIVVSEHLAHLLLKYSAPNQWPSVSVHMKLPQV